MMTLLQFLMKYRSSDFDQKLQKKFEEKHCKTNKIIRFEYLIFLLEIS